MTFGKLKQKINSVLGLRAGEEEDGISLAVDGTARKVALTTKCLKKRGALCRSSSGELDVSRVPEDFICLCDRNNTNVYYAYPERITEATPDDFDLGYDGVIADAIAYGAAAELCSRVYPGDARRYMELATEYDERVAALCEKAIDSVRNSVFGGRRI